MSEIFVNNITIYTKTDFVVTFILEDSASNSLRDLTGYSACAQMRRYETSQKTSDFNITFGEPRTTGQVSIGLGSTDTNNLKTGKYFYDVVLQNPAGVKERVIEGTVLVKKSITR